MREIVGILEEEIETGFAGDGQAGSGVAHGDGKLGLRISPHMDSNAVCDGRAL